MIEYLSATTGFSPLLIAMLWLVLTLSLGVGGAYVANEAGFSFGRRMRDRRRAQHHLKREATKPAAASETVQQDPWIVTDIGEGLKLPQALIRSADETKNWGLAGPEKMSRVGVLAPGPVIVEPLDQDYAERLAKNKAVLFAGNKDALAAAKKTSRRSAVERAARETAVEFRKGNRLHFAKERVSQETLERLAKEGFMIVGEASISKSSSPRKRKTETVRSRKRN